MNKEIHIGAQDSEEPKRCWPARLAMTLGPVLILLAYLLMIERYGSLSLNVSDDENVERSHRAAR